MRALIAGIALALLAACGFQPMYGAGPSGGAAIGPVTVEQIDGKAGHVLKTELDRILAVENNGAPPMLLVITLQERVTPLGIRVDESATRAELRLIANYVLTPPSGGRVMRGSVFSVVNYDIPTAAFGEITAQDDARERAAETMAQRFRAELALRMSQARSEGAAQ
jgi:LPS-assembly lipoprotein